MSTIPGFPSAATVVATDTLWVTQGTGVDRDKKATVSDVVKSALQGLIQGTTESDAAWVPVAKDSGYTEKFDIGLFRRRAVDLGKWASTTDFVWFIRNAVPSVPVAGTVTHNRLVIERIPPSLGNTKASFRISGNIRLGGYTGSAADAGLVALTIDRDVLPWADEIMAIITPSTGTDATTALSYMSNADVFGVATANITTTAYSGKTGMGIVFGVQWKDLLPYDGTPGARLAFGLVLHPDDIPGTL